MKEYIFGERNGIYIIDLQKTQRMFRDALAFVTQRNCRGSRKDRRSLSAPRDRPRTRFARKLSAAGQYYVNQRWLGGLLTNFQTVQKVHQALSKNWRRCRPMAVMKS